MKWFTREWARGQLSDEEAEAVPARYAEHLNEIAHRLTPDSLSLARDVDIHDGHVTRLAASVSTVELEVIAGDLQSGYRRILLTFEQASLISPLPTDSIDFLNPRTELLYDEVDVEHDGLLEYRVLTWPDGQLTIRFARVSVTTSGASASER